MAKFCPECGKATVTIEIDHMLRDACPDKHFIQFSKTKIGVGAMIIRDKTVLLIERGIPPVGLWTLVSGHLEQDETIDQAIIREVREEVGMETIPQGIIFVRNMQEHNANDLYLIFLCTVAYDACPKPDGVETTDARFIAFDNLESVNISPYAKWFIETYLEHNINPWTSHMTGFDEATTRIFTQGKL